MRASRGRNDDQEGSILLPVILLLLLLATASSAMVLQARTSLRETSMRRVRLALGYTADAAVRATALALSSASASRAAPPFAIDGTPQRCRMTDGRQLELAVQDEGGRVDLNKATPELLLQILTRAGISGPDAQAMTRAILARRDRDGSAARSAPAGSRPSNGVAIVSGPFTDPDEIDSLPGMQPDVFARLRPLFTVANGSAGVDPNVAAPAVRDLIPARELSSPAMEALTTPSNHTDFVVTATVSLADGPRFQREAGLRLDPQASPRGRFTAWEDRVVLGPLPPVPDGAFCQRVAGLLEPG